MRLRSGLQYHITDESNESTQSMMLVVDESNDSDNSCSRSSFSGNNDSVQVLASNGFFGTNRAVQIFRASDAMVHSLLRRFRKLSVDFGARFLFFVKSLLNVTPTLLGIVGGVISIVHYLKSSHQMNLFVEIDGELFSLNKIE